VPLQTFLSTPITQKCQILSCDSLVANERYIPLTSVRMLQNWKPRSNSLIPIKIREVWMPSLYMQSKAGRQFN
jgi:hypothetical protein